VLTQLLGGFVGATGNNDTSGPDGVMTVSHHEVWAGDGNSTVKVIDLFSQQVTHTISTGGTNRADEMCLDPRHHLVLVANNADSPPFASLISTTSYTVVKKIPFDGTNGAPNSNNGAEQCQWDRRTGKFYISIPGIDGQPAGTGGVAVIDPQTMQVETTFIVPLASCQAPQGMAIGPDHQILLGCNGDGGSNHPIAVIDDRNGHVIKTLANESGSDEVWFNDSDGQYFLARSSAFGANQVLGVVDADTPGLGHDDEQPGGDIKADADVITANKSIAGRNAHSVAADPDSNQVYVPIPAGVSTICSSKGGVDANGCIAVFKSPNDDMPQRLADRDHDHGN
jgi:DNA-binding beta-propeller fold protein YncE